MCYSFKNNGLEYEEIKRLLPVKPKKELIECVITKGVIKQEEVIDYEEIKCFKLVNDEKVEYSTINEDQKEESCVVIEGKYVEIIECELIEDQKVEKIESETIIENQKEEYCTIIEDKKVESYELIEEKYGEIIECELLEDQKVENNANQLIKEIIESCELTEDQEDINKLNEYLKITLKRTVQITLNE